MAKKIDNTQYLKRGDHTNFGMVTKIYDNQSFETDNKFSWNISQGVIKYKTCKHCSNKVKDDSQDLCEPCRSMAYFV